VEPGVVEIGLWRPTSPSRRQPVSLMGFEAELNQLESLVRSA